MLEKSIVDASQVLSVLLVFAGVFFDLTYRKARSLLDEEVEKDATRAAKALAGRISDFVVRRWLWVTAGYGFFFYLLTPTAVRILRSSSFHLWEFGLVRTLFVVVWLAVLAFALVSVGVLRALLGRRRELLALLA